MSLHESFGIVIWGMLIIAFITWYLRCLYILFFECRSFEEYFSEAYESSEPFFLVTFIGFICVAAFILHYVTNL